MRKEITFLGYDQNEKEIVENTNIYTKKEMVEIFKKHEKELQENFTCIEIFTPCALQVNMENIEKMDNENEFILNHVTKQIEIYMV